MGASEYDADSLYLVLAYLACKSCRIEAVLDGCCPIVDTIGELDKFGSPDKPGGIFFDSTKKLYLSSIKQNISAKGN